MKKLHLLKTMLLLCALIVGSSSVWAEDVNIASGTFNGKNESYTTGWSTTGTGKGRTDCIIIGSGENVTSPSMDLSGYSDVTISIKARRYGTLTGTKATIDASISGSSVGTTTATSTTATTSLTDITFNPTSSMTAVTVVFTCTNATSPGSSHGAGINSITITGTPKASSKTATTTTISSTGITNTDLKNGTSAGSLSATVTVTETSATVGGTTILWSSDDESVATVNEATGVVTLVGKGSANITATYEGDETYEESSSVYVITVSDTRIPTTTTVVSTGITNTDIKNGTSAGSLSANVTVTESGAAVGGATFTWTSSDPSVATINESTGAVSLVKAGTTTITASYSGGGDYAASSGTYELTVVDTRQATTVSITNWNTLFGTSFNGSVTGTDRKDYPGTVENVTIVYKQAEYMYIKDADLRIYNGSQLVFTAPTGYVFTEVAFAGTSSEAKAPTADKGTFNYSTKKWTGIASSFTLSRNSGSDYTKFTSATIKLQEATSATITAAEYATFVSPYATDFSKTGVTVYTATDNTTYVKLNEVTGGQVPANTPVVLYKEGADGSAIDVPVIAEADPVGSNDLSVVGAGGLSGEDGVYVLANKGKGVGFYLWNKLETLNEGKVCLRTGASSAREFLSFDEGETTSLREIRNEELGMKNAEYFNLNGQRVAQPTKGLYIVNGRKVVIK